MIRDRHFKALLHNNLRGSAREVEVVPSDIGLLLKDDKGDTLGTWLYDAICLDDRTHRARPLPSQDDLPRDLYAFGQMPEPGGVMECILAHDDLLTLRAHDPELTSIIGQRAPAVRKALAEHGRSGWLSLWLGIPDNLRAVILLALLLGILGFFSS